MPVYEYKCGDCGRITELLERGDNRSARKCAHCGGIRLMKQLSVFSAQVKQGESKKCLGCSDNSCPYSKR